MECVFHFFGGVIFYSIYMYMGPGTNPTVSPDDHSSSGGSQQSQAPPSGHSQHSECTVDHIKVLWPCQEHFV